MVISPTVRLTPVVHASRAVGTVRAPDFCCRCSKFPPLERRHAASCQSLGARRPPIRHLDLSSAQCVNVHPLNSISSTPLEIINAKNSLSAYARTTRRAGEKASAQHNTTTSIRTVYVAVAAQVYLFQSLVQRAEFVALAEQVFVHFCKLVALEFTGVVHVKVLRGTRAARASISTVCTAVDPPEPTLKKSARAYTMALCVSLSCSLLKRESVLQKFWNSSNEMWFKPSVSTIFTAKSSSLSDR